MKRNLYILVLVLLIALVLTSCSSAKVEAKIAEKISEKFIENITGEEVDIKLDDKEGVSIKSDSFSFDVSQSMDWPKDKTQGLKQPKGSLVNSITEIGGEEELILIGLTNFTQDVYLDYVKDLRAQGFKTISQIFNEQYVSYGGYTEDGKYLTIMLYLEDDPGGSLSLSKVDVSNHENFEDITGYDHPDLSLWPQGFVKDLPELKGKIVAQSLSMRGVTISLEGVGKSEVEDFVKIMKELGYTENSMETQSPESYFYNGENEEGFGLRLNFDNQDQITLSIYHPTDF